MDFGTGLGLSRDSAGSAFSRRIDYFVDAALGNDANDGSAGSPLRTFQEAVYRADEIHDPGFNNIFLRPGNYDGAVIDDYDLLKIFGTGANPWDVSIIGDSAEGNAIHIEGGTDTRLYNIRVTGSTNNGIYADGLNYLYMDRVVSEYNYNSGFFGENITKTKIYNSSFQYNEGFGAYVYGGNKVRSVNSDFSNNYNDGLRVEYSAKLESISTTASNNGFGGDLIATVDGTPTSDGIDANDVNSVVISGGTYNGNFRNGIDLDDVYEVKLLGVEASYNNDDGVHGDSIFTSALISGGVFSSNYGNGMDIDGRQGDVGKSGHGDPYGGSTLTIFGGQYSNNGDDGLDAADFYAANLFGIDARNNGDDGIDASYIEKLLMGGGYLYQNDEQGIEIEQVYYSQINDLVSKANGDNGLDLRGGNRLNVIGGNYSENGDWGINATGLIHGVSDARFFDDGFNGLQRVDIKFATVRENYGGVRVAYSYLGKMVGGTYSNNEYDGIVFDNVAYGIFKDIVVLNNEDYGLKFDAGLFDNGDPVLMADGTSYLNGSNWNRVDLVGGLYRNNGYDGIYISTNQNQGFYRNSINVSAKYVVSRDNGYSGLNIGGDMYDIEAGDGFVSDLYLEMVGGYYGFNADDGIYLLGEEPGLGLLVANMTDVVAEFNGGNGVIGSGGLTGMPGNIEDYAVDGQDGYYSLIQITRGAYNFNGQSGLDFRVTVFGEPGFPDTSLDGDGQASFSLASFDRVVAVKNGYDGASLSGYFAGGNGPAAFTDSEPNYPALVEFWGGVYNQNGYDGISIVSEFNDIEAMNDGPGYNFVAVRLNNVEASLNGQNGLYIVNNGGQFLLGDVEVLGGVFNSNYKDGVYVGQMGYLLVDGAVIVANKEHGLHSWHNQGTTISDNSVIVANQIQDVLIA